MAGLHFIIGQASISIENSESNVSLRFIPAEVNSITVRSQMVEAGLSLDAFAGANLDSTLLLFRLMSLWSIKWLQKPNTNFYYPLIVV